MFIIDRFEGEWAVIENDVRITFNIPRNVLPPETREGDVIILSANIDLEATAERKKQADSLLQFDE